MAEAGSFADQVKQQADIVRVVGEYVRLKKSGQNFTGLCPFHAEKSPSFAVHPVKQIYHCFGCGVGGDVFKFVMEMEKCAFPEAIRIVAEKCGIAVPKPTRPLSRRAPRKSAAHRRWWKCIVRRRLFSPSNLKHAGRPSRARLSRRSRPECRSDRRDLASALRQSGGDALLRVLKPKYPTKNCSTLPDLSRAIQTAVFYDRFRRRITVPHRQRMRKNRGVRLPRARR